MMTADFECNFSKSISINPKIRDELEHVYSRALNNQARFLLGRFHLDMFKAAESIVNDADDFEDDFVEDLTDFISQYFNRADNNLNIKNKADLNEFNTILKLSSIIMENAVEDSDLDLIYESFYQIESRLKKEKLIDEKLR